METLKIDILNPKAKLLIKDLAKLDLIRIRKEKGKSDFKNLLEKFRNKSKTAPSLEEITEEVEIVRKARYESAPRNFRH
jgi:hypothetical protein